MVPSSSSDRELWDTIASSIALVVVLVGLRFLRLDVNGTREYIISSSSSVFIFMVVGGRGVVFLFYEHRSRFAMSFVVLSQSEDSIID